MLTVLTTLRQMKLASDLPFNLNPIQDITDSLPKNPKGDWLNMILKRADGSRRKGARPFSDIKRISVHHTAVEGVPEGHARYHIGKGYGGIAYHVYIKGNQIYQVNDLLALTWHTGNNNYDTIGISVEGNFTQRSLTSQERMNLYGAIITVMDIFNIPVENVFGHRELSGGTACPGFNMDEVRKDLKNILLEMEYRRTEEYRTASIVDYYARVHHLYEVYQSRSQYWEDAERKLFTMYKLAEEHELMLPTQKGKTNV